MKVSIFSLSHDHIDWVRLVNEQLTLVEFKAIDAALQWEKVHAIVPFARGAGKTGALEGLFRVVRESLDVSCSGKTASLQSLLREVRDILRALDEKNIVKSKTSWHYLRLLAMRPLLRMQALLRQKLASAAPAARLVLTNRARQIFASHPPAAPPHQAKELS